MAIELTPSIEEPRATIDAVRIDVSGVDANTGASDTDEYPVQAEQRCYIAFIDEDDAEFGRSYVFTVGQDGAHVFNNFIFPSAGAWTMSLRSVDGDAVLKDQAITVV